MRRVYRAVPSIATELSDCAADLAVTIVLALRKRILADGSGDGPDRANAAYKEWRGARVERLCTDAARRAFEIGVLAASQGRNVRFYVAPNDAPCDACALDAASGERLAGQAFPSGSDAPATARRLCVRRNSRLKNGLGSTRA